MMRTLVLLCCLILSVGQTIAQNPTPTELNDLNKLRAAYPLAQPKATAAEVEAALSEDLFTPLPTISKEQTPHIAATVRALAYAKLSGKSGAAERLDAYLDYLSKDSVIERMPKLVYSAYGSVRQLPADLLSALPACDSLRRTRLIAGVKDLIEFDRTYLTDSELRRQINSDYLYNVLQHLFVCAIHNPDNQQAVADLKAFSHFLSGCAQYVPGGGDVLKPDGTGFHHNTHYNGYMYSYRTWVQYIGRLKGTTYRITETAYNHVAQAVVATYLMATRSTSDDNRHFAASLGGRHPYTGTQVSFTQALFDELIAIGGDILGTGIDRELAACYNYFFKTDKYKEAGVCNLDGFYSFNYSPAGVYRYGDWVATMRCPTTRFWGGELYSRQNRFGRYQSHGTLEIVYEGNLARSGYPSDPSQLAAGWDWNMPCGSTTVHYPTWKDLLPNGNDTDRFDQYALTTNFSGALSWDDCGMFAAAFDQGDSWGNRRYTPTNLTFCKSVFAFDGILVSLGTGISAIGDYPDTWQTATNLFQHIGKGDLPFMVDGTEPAQGDTLRLAANRKHYLLTPAGTGYYLPAANEAVEVIYNMQSTPSLKGLEANIFRNVLAAKAFIDHGVKPQNKRYAFYVIPGTTAEGLKQTARRIDKDLFRILAQEDSLHVLQHRPTGTVAYALFAPSDNLTYGKLRSADTALLAMERCDASGQELDLVLCCPDLRPVPDKTYRWRSSATCATLVLDGQWKLKTGTHQTAILEPADGKTRVTVWLSEGTSVHLKLDVR